jgi:hypothetical protein
MPPNMPPFCAIATPITAHAIDRLSHGLDAHDVAYYVSVYQCGTVHPCKSGRVAGM